MPLKILKASAGSGKTFQLTRHYLQLCLQQENPMFFQHILAITFTNKATQEMKEKILEACRQLAREPEKSDHLEYFKTTLNLSQQEISKRAARILDAIIYNYGRFSISTIDRFFQRVLRAFAREIKIDDAFEVRLDVKKILSAALDEMIDQLDAKHDATAGIRSMIDSRIEDQKNWKFDEDLVLFGKELFKEGLIADETLDVKALLIVKNKLRKRVLELDKQLDEFKNKTRNILEKYEVAPIEFPYKTGSFASSFLNVDNNLTQLAEKSRFIHAADSDSVEGWLPKKPTEDFRSKVEGLFGTLSPILKSAKDLIIREEFNYNTARATLRNFDSFILLAAIQKAVKQYTQRENIFVLANTQPLLKDVITSEKAPFLYEKIGSLYKYYLVDEFQDTSKLQYENLLPLMEEAMSYQQIGDSLVVGDTKQAIYRWRGGDWALLEQQVPQDFPVATQTQLEYNFRSHNAIIKFNNSFYNRAAAHVTRVLDKEIDEISLPQYNQKKKVVTQIYQESSQGLGNKKKDGGYVEVTRINKFKGERLYKSEIEAFSLALLKEKIESLHALGFEGRDLCILYRSNKEGDAIAEFLSGHQVGANKAMFQFQSDESLYLKNSYSVIATIQFLTLLVAPGNMIARLNFSQMLYLLDKSSKPSYSIISEPQFLETFFQDLESLFAMDETSEVIQMAQLFWKKTGLSINESERAYLSALQDLIIDFSRSQGNDIAGFIEYYYDMADDLKIKGDPSSKGIQLMSIHQSKGLEFEVVIIPFANWELKMKSKLWMDGRLSPEPIQSLIPISISKKLIKSHFRDGYYDESIRNYIDQLNLLYVATTRAVQQLFMFVGDGGKTDTSSATISDFILNAIEMEDAKEEDRFTIYQEGVFDRKKSEGDPKSEENETISLQFNIRTELPSIKEGIHPEALELEAAVAADRSSRSIGYIVHLIFEHIMDAKDVPQALEKLIQDGVILESELAYFKNLIDQILTDQQILPWFDRENKIIIERDILMPNGHVYRPDRIVCHKNETWILDFKSGGKSSAHQKQVYNYVRILEKMKYPNVKGFIYYTTNKELVGI